MTELTSTQAHTGITQIKLHIHNYNSAREEVAPCCNNTRVR